MDKVLVSVIMPVYNAKDYVGRAIESVLNQDFDFFELILVDDGSTDGSGDVCVEMAKRDSRVVLIRQHNAGTCAARNVALDIARGKYITFCDHDDEYLPHLLRDNFDLIERENADVLQFSVNRIFTEQENFVIEQRLKSETVLANDLRRRYLDVRLNENFVDVWNHFYRKDLISNLRFNTIFNHGMEDACFNLEIVSKVKRKYVLNSGVYYNHYLYPTSSGAVSKLEATEDVALQLKTMFDCEYDCLKNFFVTKSENEGKAVALLVANVNFLMNRVKLETKKDFEKFRDVKLFFDYPYKLDFLGKLNLWSLKNSQSLFKVLEKFDLGFGQMSFEESALFGFFKNLYNSSKGRWLFDLCNSVIKVVIIPFKLRR